MIPDSRLRRAVTIVEQYLTHPLNAARLAQDVKLSERQLNRLFHAEFGKTAREFIRSARLRYACWLLKNSQQSVTDIARRMRFSDCAHFIRHFQSEYGCTPGYGACRRTDAPISCFLRRVLLARLDRLPLKA